LIHAFAIEPKAAAAWGRRESFRFIYDKFGLGTPRVLLELPVFKNWKREVYRAATDLGLSQEDLVRIAELFRIFSEHKCRRHDTPEYDGTAQWLENAEREYDRRSFAAIIATTNPRNQPGVFIDDRLGSATPPWDCPTGVAPSRTAAEFVTTVSAILANSSVLHLVDPHFRPDRDRHSDVLIAVMAALAIRRSAVSNVHVHCSDEDLGLEFFEQKAASLAPRIPTGMSVKFTRWRERTGGEKLHNRYILTDLGAISFGVGLDEGPAGQTDDLLLLPRPLYELRWAQYVTDNGAFERADTPRSFKGTKA
jgi:hypothetical protein